MATRSLARRVFYWSWCASEAQTSSVAHNIIFTRAPLLSWHITKDHPITHVLTHTWNVQCPSEFFAPLFFSLANALLILSHIIPPTSYPLEAQTSSVSYPSICWSLRHTHLFLTLGDWSATNLLDYQVSTSIPRDIRPISKVLNLKHPRNGKEKGKWSVIFTTSSPPLLSPSRYAMQGARATISHNYYLPTHSQSPDDHSNHQHTVLDTTVKPRATV